MSDQIDLAQRYFVDDLPGSSIPSTRLRDILEKLQKGHPLSAGAFDYLGKLGLVALAKFACGKSAYEAFREAAQLEQAQRKRVAEADREAKHESMLAKAAERKAREAEYWSRQEAARVSRESDPRFIAKMKNKALRARYGIESFIDPEHLPQLMNMLHRFDGGSRLTEDDLVWMNTVGRDYFSEIFERAFHAREAEFYVNEYRRTADAWNAVNASGHYRKCEQAKEAHDLLESIPANRQSSRKLRSAIATTHGGVMRDLNRLDEALNLGDEAHALAPQDFRPCTLLGAVNFELGHFEVARDWYSKAIDRGAEEGLIDVDLRRVFARADMTKRREMRAFLLKEDPVRYRWAHGMFE